MTARHRSPDAPRPTHRGRWIAAGATLLVVAWAGWAIAYNDSLGQPTAFPTADASEPTARTSGVRRLPTPAPIFPTDATVPHYAMGTEATTNALSAPRTVSERVTVYVDRPAPTVTATATHTATATATATAVVTETSTATVTQTVITEPPVIQEEETP